MPFAAIWMELLGCSPWGLEESDMTEWLHFHFHFHFHFHALEKEMATHSSVLAWRISGTGEPGGLPSMGLHRVGHDWSNLAATAAEIIILSEVKSEKDTYHMVYLDEESKTNGTNELIYKAEIDSQTKSWLPKSTGFNYMYIGYLCIYITWILYRLLHSIEYLSLWTTVGHSCFPFYIK